MSVMKYTQPQIRVIQYNIPFTTWASVNTGIELRYGDNIALIPSTCRIIDAEIIKDTPFSAGSTVKLGISTLTSERESFASGAEVNATVAGTVSATNWRTTYNGLLKAGTITRIYARYEGAALPTAGNIILFLTVVDLDG